MLNRILSKQGILVASLIAMSTAANAAPAEAPPVFVKRISDQLIAQLKQNQSKLNDPSITNKIVAQNIEPYIDEQGFTRLVMGQYYSNQYTTAAQRAQFMQNFRDSAIRTYSRGLAKYSNDGYSLRPYRNTGAQYPVVMMDFKSSSGSKIPVAFQLVDSNNQWKIRNINVSGIDLGLTFRDQFKSTVQQNGGNMDKAIASFKPDADAVKK